jgi:hypothetical protein
MQQNAQKGTIRIELTPEQQEAVRRALGTEVLALEFTAEQLEQRIAPGGMLGGVVGS